MAEFSAYEPGTPCWVDLMSPDVDASKAFYTAVFGWNAEDQHDDEGNRIYTMFSLDGKSVAGLGGQGPGMDGMPAMWNTYIAVADCDAAAEAVTAAGGTVMMPPMQVMSSGKMAVFADPTGAAFSVWEAGEHIGAQVCNEPNTFSWSELMTRDLDRAKAFYESVFGWTIEGQDMGEMTYHVIQGGENGGLGGMMAMPAEMPDEVPANWAAYFMIADTAATVDAVRAAGGAILQDSFPIPGVGTVTVVADPAGGSFTTMQAEDS